MSPQDDSSRVTPASEEERKYPYVNWPKRLDALEREVRSINIEHASRERLVSDCHALNKKLSQSDHGTLVKRIDNQDETIFWLRIKMRWILGIVIGAAILWASLSAGCFGPAFMQVDWLTTTPRPIYVASSQRAVFHRNTCEWASKIKNENWKSFSMRNEAIEAGYEPCKVCQP